jgi:hypothetical protein
MEGRKVPPIQPGKIIGNYRERPPGRIPPIQPHKIIGNWNPGPRAPERNPIPALFRFLFGRPRAQDEQ